MRWMPLAAIVLALALPAPVRASRTETFVETNREDFAAGEADGLVWTSLGTLRLGRAVEALLADVEEIDYVADLAAAPDGTVYAVTGGTGRVYVWDGKDVRLWTTLPDKYLFSCTLDPKGNLYVGSGGTAGRLWRIRPADRGDPEVEAVWEPEDVKYLWDLLWVDGAVVAATGDEGKLWRIAPDGKAEVLLDTEADHVLCLALGPKGTLYAGTDGEALVYRLTKDGPFVLYDADEAEITGLAIDGQGRVYVGASSGTGGRTGGAQISTETTVRVTMPPEEAEGPSSLLAEQMAPDNGNDGAPEPGAEEADEPEPSEPSPAQTIARKLQQAMQQMRRAAGGGTQPGGGTGAGVYRITPEGIVTRFFDAADKMVLALVATDGKLLVGTGHEGRVYEIEIGGDEAEAVVANVDPKQVMALAVLPDGRVAAGTAAHGRLYLLSKDHAREGTYTSRVYDAGGSSWWGALDWRGREAGGEIRIATRTGNVQDPEKGPWSDWTDGAADPGTKIASPPARFIQFQVRMTSGRGDRSPVLQEFKAAHLRVNEPPRITALGEAAAPQQGHAAQAVPRMRQMAQARARGGGSGGPGNPQGQAPPGAQPVRMLQWQAADPNGDQLRFDLYFRGQGEPVWILLEENLEQPQYAWDTTTVSDGWYELRVVATDAPDNPADVARTDERVSDPILVDNTAPVFETIDVRPVEDGIEVRVEVRDATSRLVEAAWTVDSSTEWRVVAPTDRLFDARSETLQFTVEGLSPGPHRLALRAVDEAGNTAHAAKTVEVKE